MILAQGNRWKCTAKGKHDWRWRSYAILLATFGSIHLGTFSRLVATQPTSQLCSQPQHDGASSTLAKATCCVACGRSAATLVGLTATHRHERDRSFSTLGRRTSEQRRHARRPQCMHGSAARRVAHLRIMYRLATRQRHAADLAPACACAGRPEGQKEKRQTAAEGLLRVC